MLVEVERLLSIAKLAYDILLFDVLLVKQLYVTRLLCLLSFLGHFGPKLLHLIVIIVTMFVVLGIDADLALADIVH